MPKQHTFTDDGYGDCVDCNLPFKNPIHQVGTVPVNAPDPVITHHQSATSQAAGEAAWLRSGTLKAEAYHLIAKAAGGATCEEIETELGRSHQSVSSAVNSLLRGGHIRPMTMPSGTAASRANKSGHLATVWMPVREEQRGVA